MNYRDIIENGAAKSLEQLAWARAHLARFPGLPAAGLEELAAAFPLHPDLTALLGRIACFDSAARTRVLAATLARMAERLLPDDLPGFVAADELWTIIRHDAALLKTMEVEAVSHAELGLEKEIERKFELGRGREMALRVARALALVRLTTPDIYSRHGVTAVELRDLICPCAPDTGDAETGPAALLLGEVTTALNRLHRVVGAKFISVKPDEGQHFLQLAEFKRFNVPELVLHWVNAVPFLLLLATGGVMAGSRFLQAELRLVAWAKLAHQISAAMWLFGVPIAVALRLNVHWQHIRVMLRWGKDDVLWFVQSLRSLYNKQAKVPPADRFNSGQKMNAVLVMLYFVGFGGTGLVMFFKSSILFPWYVHTALFFAALGSVGGHLFLSLIAPGTRIALMGIFHGWSPMKYIEHHHPLSLPPAMREHVHAPSRKTLLEEIAISKVEVVILIVTVLLAGVGLAVFHEGQLATVKRQFSTKFSATITPNALSMRHQVGPPSESCVKCHDYTGQIPNTKCEQCHEDIKERRLKELGYHGTLRGDCRECHKEHPGGAGSIIPLDRKKFDHNLALFKLEGKHTKTDCDECHKKTRPAELQQGYFIGLKYAACNDCHKDPHQRQFTNACTQCHSVSGWQRPELKFVHDKDSAYKLEGKHAKTDCAKCHKPAATGSALGTAKFKGLPSECAGCHDDPHKKQFADTCTKCHTPAGWKKESLLFQHDRDTKFPLLAKHAEAECEKCHAPATPGDKLAASAMHGLKTGCVDCHKDPHLAQFPAADCAKCHPQPDAWKGKALRFDHSRDSKFALAGKHAATDCAKCHKPRPADAPLASAQFRELPAACEICHEVKHPVEYGKTCLSCHAIDHWIKQKPAADHVSKKAANGELLLGKHITTRCDACHNPTLIPQLEHLGTARYACATCHDPKAKPHLGTLGDNCAKCHVTEGWKGDSLKFNHDTMTNYGLNQDHKKVACVKCHENNRWKLPDTSCLACHPKINNPGRQ